MNDKNLPIISLSDVDRVEQLLESTVLALWEVVNNLARIRRERNARYRVTIFGSARATPGSPIYSEVKRLAAALTGMGCDIITGGGPGLMQAANEGAAEADAENRHRSVGIRVELPFEQNANPFVEQVFQHRTFFSRLHHFVLMSDAFVVAPGGIGTLLETAMIWQLLQVHHMHDTPLVLIGVMWKDLVDWAGELMACFDPPLASPADIAIPTCVPSAEQAAAAIAEHYTHWASGQ